MPGEPIPLSEDVERQMAEHFIAESLPQVKAVLLEYGVEPWHREVERVRFDILYLAAGDLESITAW